MAFLSSANSRCVLLMKMRRIMKQPLFVPFGSIIPRFQTLREAFFLACSLRPLASSRRTPSMTGAKKRIGGMRRPCPRLENRQLDVLDRRGKIPWYNLASASHHSHIRFSDLIHTARLSPDIIPHVVPIVTKIPRGLALQPTEMPRQIGTRRFRHSSSERDGAASSSDVSALKAFRARGWRRATFCLTEWIARPSIFGS